MNYKSDSNAVQSAIDNRGPSMWVSVSVCLFYGASSTFVAIVNKLIYQKFDYNLTMMLLLIQSFASLAFILIIYILKHCSSTVDSFFAANKITLPYREEFRARFLPTFWISATNLANISFGILGLKYVTIPMFLTIRRLVAPCTLAVAIITTKVWPSKNIFYSIGLLTLGALVAGFNDLQADYFGYFLTMMNNVLSVAYYQVLVTTKSRHKDLGFYEIYVFSTIQNIPMLLIICGGFNEYTAYLALDYKFDSAFIILMGLACVLGVCVTISIQMCTLINSPVATTVTGNTKDTVGIIISVLIFNVLLNPLLVTGIVMSLTGAVLYSVEKYKEAKAKEARALHPLQNDDAELSREMEPMEITEEKTDTPSYNSHK